VKVIEARFVAAAPTVAALPPPRLPEVAFAGRSNVGKSSLISTLAERKKLVRVSRRPGRTRSINFFEVRTDAGLLVLVDLPGYGYAEAPAAERRRWGPLVTSYLRDREALCLNVVILDPRRDLADDDLDLLRMLTDFGRPTMLVATKMDKLSKAQRKPAVERLSSAAGLPVLPFSAHTGEGSAAVWQVVGRACGIV
jgi:GTP-binding protein